MPKPIVKGGVNGYGVIGKRVADAVSLQNDMKLIGISDIVADWRVKMAAKKNYPIYCSIPEKIDDMKKGGVEVVGTLEDLLREVDVIIDCTPKGIGAKNKSIYEKFGVKAIFQGGEKHEVAGVSFVAQCNYAEALGKQFVRVVSCNTTALCRVLGAIKNEVGIKKARAFIVRRAVDVWESGKRGIMNTVVPTMGISHHAPDVKTVLHDLDIVSMAVKASHNLFHLHFCLIETERKADREDIIEALDKAPRVVFVSTQEGIDGLHAVFELGRDLGRSRGDIYEIPVWKDSITIVGSEAYLSWSTPNESNVIPENIDAIRAIMEVEEDWRKSVEKTDKALGIVKKFY
ncbi:MAG: type II glyceraldehyde-3-phosphate dehydrogenase [Candidatus Methanomethylicota archaeon]|uniref:Glyceraldehyde-3-phosphate dehydrogenase n=1 Tax=Thermoproteota archaeon TaxID=2056631 RepID=A0A497EXC7_9CREN|nr:MAG: type II glyceraldehyde-3-phosphate dehydrogenase [Candidatus Verstraetearchaeota archaeon]